LIRSFTRERTVLIILGLCFLRRLATSATIFSFLVCGSEGDLSESNSEGGTPRPEAILVRVTTVGAFVPRSIRLRKVG